jgi:hypothetical protein
MGEEETRRAFEARLQEYQQNNKVALESWQRRYFLISLNIATIGSLIGLTFSHSESSYIYLSILSFITSSLAIVWLGENYWVTKLSINNRKYVIPSLRLLASNQDLFKENIEKTNFWKMVLNIWLGKQPGAAIGFLLFWLPSVASWVVAIVLWLHSQDRIYLMWILFLADFILFIPLTAGGIVWYRENKKYLTTINEEHKS